MCLQPIRISNKSPETKSGFKAYASSYLVPCGHCAQCLHNQQQQVIQKMRQVYKGNYCFFITLTYNDSTIHDDHHSIECYGNHFHNVLTSDISHLFKRIRNHWRFPFLDGDSLKYHFFSEYGGKTHRPHWHGIIQFPKAKILSAATAAHTDYTFLLLSLENYLDEQIQANWKTQIGGTHRKPIYRPNSSFFKPTSHKRGTYDFHLMQDYVLPNGKVASMDNVAFYATKYMLKPDRWLDSFLKAIKINYPTEVYDFVKTKRVTSKNADQGCTYDIWDMVKKNYPIMKFPCYETTDGKTFPLSQRYRKILPMAWCELDRKYNPQDWHAEILDTRTYKMEWKGHIGSATVNGVARSLVDLDPEDLPPSRIRWVYDPFTNRDAKTDGNLTTQNQKYERIRDHIRREEYFPEQTGELPKQKMVYSSPNLMQLTSDLFDIMVDLEYDPYSSIQTFRDISEYGLLE